MAEQVSEATVLFADVSGSTKLYETAGDAVAHAAIEKCVNLMREKTVAAKGRVIKTIGDEVMSAFPGADNAADAAIEMQSAIAELPPVGSTQIGIRIGFNHGPVVERDGDVFGDAVNLAARLEKLAGKFGPHDRRVRRFRRSLPGRARADRRIRGRRLQRRADRFRSSGIRTECQVSMQRADKLSKIFRRLPKGQIGLSFGEFVS